MIESTGFGARRVRNKRAGPAALVAERIDLPPNAPEFLRSAVLGARAESRPVVLGFHATWCRPCRKLEATTFADAAVRALLERAPLVKIDLDEHPRLARHYRVNAVPHLLLIDRDGRVVERLTRYVSPDELVRLLRALLAD